MAVIQISKIQVRRGLQENLPQLASGEFGWSVDQQRLYIGNGTISEGAPALGNTEILTANRDILSAIQSYIFKGQESGYTSMTGPNLLSPVTRSLQNKLDERVSVRDFGVVGDGATDDTARIQRAINEVYPPDYFTTVGVRRKLHFPAGTYRITGTLTIPPYANLCGDGEEGTIIRQDSAVPVIYVRDSRGNFGSAMNTLTSTLPFQISISDLTLSSSQNASLAVVDSTTDMHFIGVNFSGNIAVPSTNSAAVSAIQILNTKGNVSQISVYQSHFSNVTYGIKATGNVLGVNVHDCVFYNMYQGIYTSANIGSPQHVKVVSSIFDHIAKQAVWSGDDSSVITAFNHFRLVGNGDDVNMNSGSANSAILTWNTSNNRSFGDIYSRSLADMQTVPVVQVLSGNTASLHSFTTFGTVNDSVGYRAALAGNTLVASNVGLTLSNNSTSIIDYSISRLGNVRVGTIKVTQTGGAAVFEDNYSETGGGTQVVLDFQGYGSQVAMTYTTTSTFPLQNGTIKYTVRSFV